MAEVIREPDAAEGEASYKNRNLPYREAKPQSLPGIQNYQEAALSEPPFYFVSSDCENFLANYNIRRYSVIE